MKFMGAFGPPGQLLLRTPNLCAHILFLVSTWLLLSSVKDMRLRICLFIIVNTNPFMLDYFSMARGYGLSMGFMAMSLYFLKEFMENKKNNWLLHQSMALFGAILAVLSNFSMLMYYFGLCLVMAIWILNMVLRHGFTLKQFLQSTTCFLIAFLPIFLYVLPKIWQLKSAGAFYYGGNQGFWKDTVEPLFEYTLYGKPHIYYIARLLYILTIITLITAAFQFGKAFYLNKIEMIENEASFYSIFIIMTLCAGSSVLNHYLFGVPFLEARTALFLLVLFNLMAALLLNRLFEINRKWIWAGYFFCFAAALNLIICASGTEFLMFRTPADLVIQDIEKEHVKNSTAAPVRVSSIWIYGQSVAFYQVSHNDIWMSVDKDGKDSTADYFVSGYGEINSLNKKGYLVFRKYHNFNAVLLKKQVQM